MKTNTSKKRMLLASIFASATCFGTLSVRADDYPGNPYYEDDAWYDVSEWFDGNDYNPTDEAIGRWDNETFQFSENLTSSDNKNYFNWGDYGYAENTQQQDRWFYDYYDDGYGQWNRGDEDATWDTYNVYTDSNDDGLYDTYSYYSDSDSDGMYEDYASYQFSGKSSDRNQASSSSNQKNKQKEMQSRKMEISGTVTDTKMTQVRDRVNLVARVKTDDGKQVMVDLGSKNESAQLFAGDKLSASGYQVKVGDKKLLVATEAEARGANIVVDRSGRKYQGKVQSTREVTAAGGKHVLAKLKTSDSKSLLVDLGPKSQWDKLPSEGDQVTVEGVPVQMKDRVVLMARTLERDGKRERVSRGDMQKNAKNKS